MRCLPCVLVYDKNLCSVFLHRRYVVILTEVNMDIDSHLGEGAHFYDFNIEQENELNKVLRILHFSK